MWTIERDRIDAIRGASRVAGLAVAVVSSARVLYLGGFGVADQTRADPVGPHTTFAWFSMTKIATATAIMALAGETGVVDLDAPVETYVPSFAVVRGSARVTVRHLLGHRSGLANPVPIRWVRPATAPAPDQHAFTARLLARHRRLRFEPGERARYSNLGFLVLGEVVSAVSGQSFEHFVRDRILSTLDMRHTGFAYPPGSPPATGYQPVPAPVTPLLRLALPAGIVWDRHGRDVAYHPFLVTGAAYGGLVGDVADAARLAMMHLGDGVIDGHRVLAPGVAARMRQLRPSSGGRLDFGLGWYRPAGRCEPYVEHLGGGSGFLSVIRLYPERDVGVVVMGNRTRYDHEAIIGALLGPVQ